LGVYKHSKSEIASGKKLENKKENFVGHTLYTNSFAGDEGNPVGKIDFNSTAIQDCINKNEEIIAALANPMRLGKTHQDCFMLPMVVIVIFSITSRNLLAEYILVLK